MARVCLLAPTVAAGDAVGHDIAGMFAALQAHGVDTQVFAERWTPGLELPVQPVARYVPDRTTLTVYHHSIHSDDAAARFIQAPGPRVLRYHNVTPSHFFAPYSAELTRATELGRAQTQALVAHGGIDLFLADSDFNARELRDCGAPRERCQTLSPFHALHMLADTCAAVTVLARHLDGERHMVCIGRVVPNKGHLHLLQVLSAYRRHYPRPLRLFVVGALDQRVAGYLSELYALAERLGVADAVVWTDHVSAAELKAYLLLAHAFVLTSEHEGFCVPVVEAMAHGVPIVAHASDAVRETVGNAGILIEGMDYAEYAAALELLFTRDDYRAALAQAGRTRVARYFDADTLSQRFITLLDPFLQRASGAATPA
jgi:glycosyltransferase involved in cell wall biosynthesis